VGTNYSKGRTREYYVMQDLEGAGYQCLRTAGSHGMWDVIAIGPHDIRLIQVKLNCKPSPAELQAIRAFRVIPGILKQLWIFKSGQKKPIDVQTI